MRQKMLVAILFFFFLAGSISCAEPDFVAEKQQAGGDTSADIVLVGVDKNEIAEKDKKIKDLELEIVRWKARYYEMLLENVKLAESVKMYRSDRYAIVKRALDDTSSELRTLENKEKEELEKLDKSENTKNEDEEETK